MQNINHFLIFSNTYNPKHTPPPPKKKNPPTTNPLKKNPSAPSCSECSECSQNPPPKKSSTQKRQKKIATRQAGSNHYIKQLLSL
ncbi:MAG: hypothetical protein SO194_01580, partial [Sodaliphilus sp.]|nr:hypothetical protein [Sodaliphilus sp.]